MEAGIKELYARQLSMLCARALKGYKAALVKLLDGDMLGEDSEANVLRQVCACEKKNELCCFVVLLSCFVPRATEIK